MERRDGNWKSRGADKAMLCERIPNKDGIVNRKKSREKE